MKLEEGITSVPSKMGTFCSLLLMMTVLTFTYYKVDVLLGRKDVDVLSAVAENYFDSSDSFSGKQGLNVAVSLFNAQNSQFTVELDPSYGRIRFQILEWGTTKSGKQFRSNKEIDSHICSLEELGLTGTDPKFMPVNKHNFRLFVPSRTSMRCID